MINQVGAAGTGFAPAGASGPGGNMGKDEFLKILVAQLKHQDPMNPMQGNEMAVQLAQFSSVEQLINLNQALQYQTDLQGAIVDALNGSAAVSAIGKEVLAAGDLVTIPEEGEVSVTIAVDAVGGRGTLRIFDEQGREVGSRELGLLKGGRQDVALGSAADGLPPGTYTYAVEVRGEGGEQIPVSTYFRTRIDGIRYTAEGPMLTGNGVMIPFGSILEILAAR
jgi:flagellar basal-body rod modification protein FlgD